MIEGLLMNTEEINQLWAEVCSRVKSYEGIIGPQVDALFSQLFPQAASDGFMMLTANTEFIKNFIERHYIDCIKRALEEIRGVPFDVLIGIDESQVLHRKLHRLRQQHPHRQPQPLLPQRRPCRPPRLRSQPPRPRRKRQRKPPLRQQPIPSPHSKQSPQQRRCGQPKRRPRCRPKRQRSPTPASRQPRRLSPLQHRLPQWSSKQPLPPLLLPQAHRGNKLLRHPLLPTRKIPPCRPSRPIAARAVNLRRTTPSPRRSRSRTSSSATRTAWRIPWPSPLPKPRANRI